MTTKDLLAKGIDQLEGIDAMTTITSGVVIAIITIGKVVHHFWKKHKHGKEQENTEKSRIIKTEEFQQSEPDMDDYKPFLRVINDLDDELKLLKQEVENLAILKTENADLKKTNSDLEAINKKLTRKVKTLGTKNKNLTKKRTKLPV